MLARFYPAMGSNFGRGPSVLRPSSLHAEPLSKFLTPSSLTCLHGRRPSKPRSTVHTRLGFLIDFREELGEFLLAVFLVEALINFGDLRRVHRTELRPAHRAELRFLVEIVRQSLVVHCAGSLWIE